MTPDHADSFQNVFKCMIEDYEDDRRKKDK